MIMWVGQIWLEGMGMDEGEDKDSEFLAKIETNGQSWRIDAEQEQSLTVKRKWVKFKGERKKNK